MSDPAPAPGSEAAGRFIGALLSLLSGLMILAALVMVGWRTVVPRVIADIVLSESADHGLTVETLTVETFWIDRLVVTDLRLADGTASLARLDATFSADRLWRTGRLDRIVLDGARVRLALDEAGHVRWPGASPRPDGAGEAGWPSAPADAIVVRDATLEVATPFGPATVALEADVRAAEGADTSLSAQLGVGHASGAAAASVQARMAADGATEARLDLIDGWYRGDAVRIDDLAAMVRGTGSPDGLRSASGSASVARLDWAGAAFRDLSADGRTDGVTAALSVEGSELAAEARAALDVHLTGLALDGWAVGEPRFHANLAATVDAVDRALALAQAALPLDGRATLALELAGGLGEANGVAPGFGPLHGRVSASLADGAWLDVATDVSALLQAEVAVTEEGVVLSGDQPWVVVATPDGWEEPVSLLLGPGEDGRPLRLHLAHDGGGDIVAALHADGLGARLDGHLEAAVGAGALGDATIERLVLSARGTPVAVDGLAVEPRHIAVTAAGPAHRLSGTYDLRLGLAGSPTADVEIVGGRVEGRGAFDLADERMRLSPDGCVVLAAESIVVTDVARLPDGLDLCLAGTGAEAAVEVDFDGSAVTSWRVRGQGEIGPVDLLVEAGAELLPITVQLPALAVSLTGTTGEEPATVMMTAGPGTLRLPSADVVVTGIEVTGQGDLGAEPDLTVRVAAASIDSGGRLPPLAFTGTVETTPDGALGVVGRAVGLGGALVLTLTGRQDLDTGEGRLDVTLPSIAFAPEGLQPDAVVPALHGRLREASGRLSGEGQLLWGRRSTSSGTLRLENLSFEADPVVFVGVHGEVTFDSLWPPTTPSNQRLFVWELDAGVPMTNGVARFALLPDRGLEVSELRFAFADGNLAAEPFTYAFDETDHSMVLLASDLDFAALMTEIPLEGLEVSGRLDGRMPLRLTDDTIAIDNGELRTRGPGIIRYDIDPVDVDQEDESIALLLAAVRNFHYNEIIMTLNGTLGDELQVGLRIQGANPDLYDGYPIALNVNVSGALADILRRGLTGERLIRRAEEYFRERAADGARGDRP